MAFNSNDWDTAQEVETNFNISALDSKQNYIGVSYPESVNLAKYFKGLNTTDEYIGFSADGTTMDTYIKADGTFNFNGDDDNYINWDGSLLTLSGNLQIFRPNDYKILAGIDWFGDVTKSINFYTGSSTSEMALNAGGSSESFFEINQYFDKDNNIPLSKIRRIDYGSGLLIETFPLVEDYILSNFTNERDGLVSVAGDYSSNNANVIGGRFYGTSDNNAYGVYSEASGDNLGVGVYGKGTSYGGKFEANGKSALNIVPIPFSSGYSTSNRPTWTGEKGSFNVDGDGQLWFHNGTEWKLVSLQ